MQKIAIVTSGHPPFDERIFYKFGRTLAKKGYTVSIICSTKKTDTVEDTMHIIGFDGENINKREKISKLSAEIEKFNPEVIICCEPLTILAARKASISVSQKIKIFYDITEWYPENVSFKMKGLKKIFSYILLFLFNIYSSNLADVLIFGEKLKKKRYQYIAPIKKKHIIEYYPVLEFFQYSPPLFDGKTFTIAFTGLITVDRGILNILKTVELLAERNPNVKIRLKLIGKYTNLPEDEMIIKKINSLTKVLVEIIDWVGYKDFSAQFTDVDLCLDLREKNFIYNNSLPIKLFDYLACGKPVIYSNIKAIREELDFTKFGYLVEPSAAESIVSKIEKYIENPNLLREHSTNARFAAENYFNWEKVEGKLIKLIKEN
ncbi:MAG: glycosyltransferase [Ignavibacteriales bacterium]|nr:glycosyltransferase [Ignavibacteriales bacterium]